MSLDRLPRPDDPPAAHHRFVLAPHRSLGRRGFIVLMAFVGAVSFAAGLVFALMGAWPVLGFFGLDVALIWLAFRLNYRSGRRRETIDIEDGTVTLTRIDAKGQASVTYLAAAWADVRLYERTGGSTAIALASHGIEHSFGGFLTNIERRQLAAALRSAVVEARGGPRI